jgi:hypothetical protein
MGFLILLALRFEAVTGTEVFHMHPSTAVQFVTLNYPREVFCTTQRSSWSNCEFAFMTAPLRGEKTLALNRKGVYPPEVYWVQWDCRDTGRGRGAHIPCRVQSSPQESRIFLVLFEQCTGLQRWKIIICLRCTQLYGDWVCVGRDKTCGALNKHEELEFEIFRQSAVQLLPNSECVVSLSLFTRGIADCMMVMNWKNRSTFISQRKVAAVTPDYWSPT